MSKTNYDQAKEQIREASKRKPPKKRKPLPDYERKVLGWLSQVDLDDRRRKFSGPAHAIVKKSFSYRNANGLQNAICRLIHLCNGDANRINVMGRKVKKGDKWVWIPSTTKKGTGDILASLQGRSLEIEVKFGKDRQSEAQKERQEFVISRGGIYIVAKSLHDVITFLNHNFSNLPIKLPSNQ